MMATRTRSPTSAAVTGPSRPVTPDDAAASPSVARLATEPSSVTPRARSVVGDKDSSQRVSDALAATATDAAAPVVAQETPKHGFARLPVGVVASVYAGLSNVCDTAQFRSSCRRTVAAYDVAVTHGHGALFTGSRTAHRTAKEALASVTEEQQQPQAERTVSHVCRLFDDDGADDDNVAGTEQPTVRDAAAAKAPPAALAAKHKRRMFPMKRCSFPPRGELPLVVITLRSDADGEKISSFRARDPSRNIEVIVAGATVIGPGAFTTCCMRHFTVTAVAGHAPLVTLGRVFLSQATITGECDLEGLHCVRDVGYGFMSEVEGVRRLDVSTALRGAEVIAFGFLEDAKDVEEVILGDTFRLAEIGDNFCSGCPVLGTIRVVRLPALEILGRGVLSHCPCLASVWLDGLPALRRIGNCALFANPRLRSLEIRGAPALEHIGSWFAARCPLLASLRLQGPLPHLKVIEGNFAAENTGLETVELPEELPALTHFADETFSQCTSLTSFTLPRCPRLHFVGGSFMYNCTALRRVELSGAEWLRSIPGALAFKGVSEATLVAGEHLNEWAQQNCADYFAEIITTGGGQPAEAAA